jgi:hypothetical protein
MSSRRPNLNSLRTACWASELSGCMEQIVKPLEVRLKTLSDDDTSAYLTANVALENSRIDPRLKQGSWRSDLAT